MGCQDLSTPTLGTFLPVPTCSDQASVPTFREAATRTFELNRPRWRSQKTAANWTAQMELHAFPVLATLPVNEIGREAVPARADANLDRAPGYRPQAAKACLRFVVLTACRAGEARGAKWSELDVKAREWRIPASRMKANVEHRVPLSAAVVGVLDRVRPLRNGSDLVFPSQRGQELSDATMTKCLRTAGIDAVPHGFRNVVQDLGQRTDQRAARGRGDGARACRRVLGRAELCTVGPVREAPRPDGSVGGACDTWQGTGGTPSWMTQLAHGTPIRRSLRISAPLEPVPVHVPQCRLRRPRVGGRLLRRRPVRERRLWHRRDLAPA